MERSKKGDHHSEHFDEELDKVSRSCQHLLYSYFRVKLCFIMNCLMVKILIIDRFQETEA